MLHPDVRATLDGACIAHLATTLPDFSPHCTPVFGGSSQSRGLLHE